MDDPTATPRPTDAELAILRVLWRLGPSTVRQVRNVLARAQPTGYTTVLKTLQIMTAKGLVERDEASRSHIYRAARGEEATQRRLVDDLLDKAFGGSAAALVARALGSRPATVEELAEIRRLLDNLEARGGGPSR